MGQPFLLLAGGYEGKIITLAFDPTATPPSLQIVSESSEGGIAPTWLTLSPDGKHVWSADEWGEGEGVLSSFNLVDGVLLRTSTTPSGGLWPCHSSLLSSTDPPRLLTTNYRGSTLSSIPILPTGELEQDPRERQTVSFKGTGTPGPVASRQQQDHPHQILVDPTGKFALVPDLGTDCVKVLRVNELGDLVRGPSDIVLAPGDGPRHVLFHVLPSGETLLYVLNELSNSITIFSVTYPVEEKAHFPTFTALVSHLSLLPPSPFPHQTSFATWHCAELKIATSGASLVLITSNRSQGHDPANADPSASGPDDLLALFPLDPSSGLPRGDKPILLSSGGKAPRHFSLASEGRDTASRREGGAAEWVAVALHDSDEVVIFELVGEGEKVGLKEIVRKKGVGKPGVVLFL